MMAAEIGCRCFTPIDDVGPGADEFVSGRLARISHGATALIWLGEAARLAMANSMRSMPKGDGATMRPLVLDDNLLSCVRIINREGIMVGAWIG